MTSNHLNVDPFIRFLRRRRVANRLLFTQSTECEQCKSHHHLPIVCSSVFIRRLCGNTRKSLVLIRTRGKAEWSKYSGWLVPLSCLAYIPFSWTFSMDATWDFVLEFFPSCHIIIEISWQDEPEAYRRHEYAIIPTWAHRTNSILFQCISFYDVHEKKVAEKVPQNTNYMDMGERENKWERWRRRG